ncbi:alpha/beta fold hydrolase [Microbacterium atlanticum]|uniref:alpha/beta fold hydrolase n=1 Tax=Microbacterium atlanticum TaxID=2782168 RepID=UPI0018877AF6|nr:alpha/beta hydrolase [Microbacterium atlanticum]
MATELILKNTPIPKPLDEWKSIAVELLGTQTRFVQGEKWRHRIIESGFDNDAAEPLILIHGMGGHAETFARNMHNLAAHGFHVVAIDALFHGYTDKEPWNPDTELDLQADALADLVRALGYEKAHIEGESLGASILFEFGLRYPELCGKLILNTAVGRVKLDKSDFVIRAGEGDEFKRISQQSVTDPSFEAMQPRMSWLVGEPSRMTDEMVEVRLRLYQDPAIHQAMKRVYRLDGGEYGPQFQPRHDESTLASFPHEVLVFWTELNPGYGPDYAEYVAHRIPGAQYYIMKDAAHWPQWEKPEEHDQVLIEFIKGA